MRYITSALPALSRTKLVPTNELHFSDVIPDSAYYSLVLWRSTLTLRNVQKSDEWSNWSGFMHHVHRTDNFAVDETMLLPIIDLNPNDPDCIYSTLCYISEQARRLSLPSTSVTFDQPLFIKAVEIAESKDISNIVVRLGGFHLLMSALGSLYDTMKGSGVDEALGQVFATNALPMVLSGKAFSRCYRGTHLLSAALHHLLLRNVNTDTESSLCDDLQRLITSIENPLCEDPLVQIIQSSALVQLDKILTSTKQELAATSRTAKLWVQFIDYVGIIDDFIVAERTKYWNGHLNACYKLLNLFAATGHINYAKTTRLYLQNMSKLELNHPWLYRKYVDEGCFAVQRSSHPFNGLWSDLVIEQVVMASLKNSRSGLTHGRGLTESVRQQWIYSLPIYAAVHDAMSQLTQRHRLTSDQHIELGKTRKRTDTEDVDKIREWFLSHDPFTDNPVLRPLSTGITVTGTEVNCDECENVGQAIQTKLDNVPYTQAKISRKETIRTLQHLQSGVVVEGKKIQIDPRILFSRLSSVVQRMDTDVETFLDFEMAISPPSLFDCELMRKADKSELGRYLLDLDDPDTLSIPVVENTAIVIDGGWLLHRVRWSKNLTYQEIVELYVNYVRKFGTVTVIFDGYDEACTKDHEHRRRQSNSVSATIEVELNRRCHNDQKLFLANSQNKIQLIHLLSNRLLDVGHSVLHSSSDADTLIASTALRFASEGEVLVMAEDTDILVMVIHHFNDSQMHDIKLCKFSKTTKEGLLYSIRTIINSLDSNVRKCILFIHAWGGCDTTSGTFNQGKISYTETRTKR